jgi:hypothetical protein
VAERTTAGTFSNPDKGFTKHADGKGFRNEVTSPFYM